MKLKFSFEKENELNLSFMKYILVLIFSFSILSMSSQIVPVTDDGRTIKVPIVIHLVKKGKRHNTPKLITKEIITQQISLLNKNFAAQNDMSLLNAYFTRKNLVGIPNFQFFLKEIVVHKRHRRAKRIKRIDSEKNLHIIVGKYRNASPSTLAKGYTPEFIQIDYRNFGDNSQTVTHEIGHWLGLFHVWGMAGNCKRPGRFVSDFVDDTPTQYGCTDADRKNPCPPKEVSTSPNYNNFMDYSSCRCFFTKGQVQIMREKVIKFRNIIFKNSL